MGRQGIIDGYLHGRGKITLRARAEIIEEAKGKTPSILIREVPFQVSRIPLLEEIGQLVKDERISGIRDIRDESAARNGEPVRIVVELTTRPTRTWSSTSSTSSRSCRRPSASSCSLLIDGRRAVPAAQGDDGEVPGAPDPGHPPAHRVPAPRGEAPRARPRRPAHRHRQHRGSHPHLPHLAEPRGGQAPAARNEGAREHDGARPSARRRSPRSSGTRRRPPSTR